MVWKQKQSGREAGGDLGKRKTGSSPRVDIPGDSVETAVLSQPQHQLLFL